MKQPNRFLQHAGVTVPVICGAMYPCSNPELIAAVSEAGGLGVIQPVSLTFVHGYELRAGIQKIRTLTQKPLGFNVLTESSVKFYQKKMEAWLQIALEEGIRFFITALGDPGWVVKQVKPLGGMVYHDLTERKYALKVADKVDGFICVNNRAGGHAGLRSAEELYADLADLNKPLICAGGIGNAADYKRALAIGYEGVQMGTRFIATRECTAHEDYKKAILNATEKDIVITDRVTGVSLSVIKTPYLEKIGIRAGPLARFFLKGRHTKHFMRFLFSMQSLFKLKNSNFKPLSTKDYWQAGKSVASIEKIESAGDIVRSFAQE